LIAGAKKYPEGFAVRFEPVMDDDIPPIATLAHIKLKN